MNIDRLFIEIHVDTRKKLRQLNIYKDRSRVTGVTKRNVVSLEFKLAYIWTSFLQKIRPQVNTKPAKYPIRYKTHLSHSARWIHVCKTTWMTNCNLQPI